MIVFKNKTFKIEREDIKQDNSGNYKTVFFLDLLNGKNVSSFSSLEQAKSEAIRNENTYFA